MASAYDSTVYDGVHDRKDLKDAFDYIASNAKESKFFGKKNVFIAEWGLPENEFSQEDLKKLTHNVIETGLNGVVRTLCAGSYTVTSQDPM